jgi:hypothetical protein
MTGASGRSMMSIHRVMRSGPLVALLVRGLYCSRIGIWRWVSVLPRARTNGRTLCTEDGLHTRATFSSDRRHLNDAAVRINPYGQKIHLRRFQLNRE